MLQAEVRFRLGVRSLLMHNVFIKVEYSANSLEKKFLKTTWEHDLSLVSLAHGTKAGMSRSRFRDQSILEMVTVVMHCITNVQNFILLFELTTLNYKVFLSILIGFLPYITEKKNSRGCSNCLNPSPISNEISNYSNQCFSNRKRNFNQNSAHAPPLCSNKFYNCLKKLKK